MFTFNVYALPLFFVGVCIFAIGLFIYLQNKKSLSHLSFGLICLSITVWLSSFGVIYLLKNAKLALSIYRYVTFLGVVNIMPSIYFFAIAWRGKIKEKRSLVIAGYIAGFLFYLLGVTTNLVIPSIRHLFWGFYPKYGPIGAVFITYFTIQFVINLSHLISAYKDEEVPIKQTQMKLITLGLLFSSPASADFVAKVTPHPLYPFGYLPMFLLVCTVAYAIIKYKAFDIETVIHKTAMWILTSFIIILPLVIVSQIFYPRLQKTHPLYSGIWIAGLCIVLLLYFRFVQPLIDNIFQRRRHNLEEASARFAAELVHLKGLNDVVKVLEKTIKDNLYAQKVDIYVYNEDLRKYLLASGGTAKVKNWAADDLLLKWFSKNDAVMNKEFLEIDPMYEKIKQDARAYFQKLDSIMLMPLVLNDTVLGIISLGKKSNLRRYNSIDYQFLMRLKSESTIAISNSMLYDRIEEKVRQRTEELIKTQQQLIQAEKLATVGTLAGGVAHEINNPLTAIMTNVQMLLSAPSSEFDKESLSLIEEAAKRCRNIVQKLMVYARKPQEKEASLKVDLAKIVESVNSFLGYQLSQENVNLSIRVNGPAYIVGAPNELEQVLTNIVLNAKDAIKDIKKQGQVEISISKQDNKAKIEIKDDGPGIPKEVLPKIFDPFFTTKAVGKGTGLGLSICQAIIQRHNGSISADSEPGVGTTFKIELPLVG